MIYSFLYVLSISLGLVFIQYLDVSVSPVFSLMITASVASIYFNVINIGSLKKIYLDCFRNKKLWIFVMLLVFVMWFYAIASPGLIGASLSTFLYSAWLCVLGYFFQAINDWKKEKAKLFFAFSVLILISISTYSEIKYSLSMHTVYGVLLAVIGGTSAFIYFKVSQAFAKNSTLSASQILAVRFYLAIFVLFIVLPKQSFSYYVTWTNLLSLISLAFIAMIVPLYFSQKALEKITSEQHAIISSLSPVVTGILQEMIF